MADREIPAFEFKGASVATTYRFLVPQPIGGGALCTVNDSTGELSISSDWGSWSHRWGSDPAHLGAPTLTHFIADRDAWDYLAAKLLTRGGCYEWDRKATVREFQRELARRRLDFGRRLASGSAAKFGRHHLSREQARELWDEIEDIGREDDQRTFIERFIDDSYLTYWVSEQPYEELQQQPSRAYQILTAGILPALIGACTAEVQRRAGEVTTVTTYHSSAGILSMQGAGGAVEVPVRDDDDHRSVTARAAAALNGEPGPW